MKVDSDNHFICVFYHKNPINGIESGGTGIGSTSNGVLKLLNPIIGIERRYPTTDLTIFHVFIVERSGRRGVVAVSIQGRERSIGESIAELIKMRYNEDVGSDKGS